MKSQQDFSIKLVKGEQSEEILLSSANLKVSAEELREIVLSLFPDLKEGYVMMKYDESSVGQKFVVMQDDGLVCDEIKDGVIFLFPLLLEITCKVEAIEYPLFVDITTTVLTFFEHVKEAVIPYCGVEFSNGFQICQKVMVNDDDNNNSNAEELASIESLEECLLLEISADYVFYICPVEKETELEKSDGILCTIADAEEKAVFGVECHKNNTISQLRNKLGEVLNIFVSSIQLARRSEHDTEMTLIPLSLDRLQIVSIFSLENPVVVITKPSEVMENPMPYPELPGRRIIREMIYALADKKYLLMIYESEKVDEIVAEIAWNHSTTHDGFILAKVSNGKSISITSPLYKKTVAELFKAEDALSIRLKGKK